MTLTMFPKKLRGTITPPPSKSQAHRLLLAAALADGVSKIENVAFSQDIQATLSCMEQLGARWERRGDAVCVTGIGGCRRTGGALPQFDCGESGSTLRFLIPIALAVAGGGVFTGHGRLMERPQKPYFDLFDEKGIFWEQKDGVLTVRGTLEPGEYRLPGNVSSQFFTGLLYALPLLGAPSVLVPTTPLESEGYIAMTLAALAQFGVEIPSTRSLPPQYLLPADAVFCAQSAAVEADWSQAGFFLAAQGMGNALTVTGLNMDSLQGDRIAADYFARLDGPGSVELDVSGCPDLVPPLAVRAALRAGQTTVIANAARLRIKESDRLKAVTEVLGTLGARIEEGADFLRIEGLAALPGGTCVDAHNDHRIAMMTAIAATCCKHPVTLTGAQCVAKSYPDFWEDYARLGGAAVEEQ